MTNQFSRTQLLLGFKAMETLSSATVAVFGIGGVGSFSAEALARSGVGRIVLFDMDEIGETNINRQLIALMSTIGRKKVDVMRDRIMDINPEAIVEVHPVFYGESNACDYDLSRYSYIIDAIDTVSSKIILIERAQAAGVQIISCMGAGNKLDPTAFEVDDIYNTSVCPLAKVMRRELRARGIQSLKVVYSKETPRPHMCREEKNGLPVQAHNNSAGKPVPGSISFVPSVAGLILAGEVIKDITGIYSEKQTK
jgi:tRNA A37 threonylcarbamoyladenosine dehydratase